MKFISNRDIIVRTSLGHAIGFKKGEPTYVPPAIREIVMEKGILPVDEDNKPIDPADNTVVVDKPKVLLAPESGEEIEAQVLKVIEQIVARNNPDDFAGGGYPSAKSITAALGYRVDQKTVKPVWEKHRQRLLNPET